MPAADPVAVVQLIPTLHVRDVEQAAAWYRDVMGWEVRFLAPPDYAGVAIGGNVLHLAQWQREGELPLGQVYVKLAGDVDGYFERLERRGAQLHQRPKDQPYGMRECNLRDLDGNYLHVGQERSP